jgi:hypothetical protein
MPLQAELLPAADIFLRYLCHFDAAKVDLSGPDPKFDDICMRCVSENAPIGVAYKAIFIFDFREIRR